MVKYTTDLLALIASLKCFLVGEAGTGLGDLSVQPGVIRIMCGASLPDYKTASLSLSVTNARRRRLRSRPCTRHPHSVHPSPNERPYKGE